MEASWVVHRLREAIGDHGTPEIINSDQGVQFTSEEYISYVKSSKSVRISMDGKGRVIDNVFIRALLENHQTRETIPDGPRDRP